MLMGFGAQQRAGVHLKRGTVNPARFGCCENAAIGAKDFLKQIEDANELSLDLGFFDGLIRDVKVVEDLGPTTP